METIANTKNKRYYITPGKNRFYLERNDGKALTVAYITELNNKTFEVKFLHKGKVDTAKYAMKWFGKWLMEKGARYARENNMREIKSHLDI